MTAFACWVAKGFLMSLVWHDAASAHEICESSCKWPVLCLLGLWLMAGHTSRTLFMLLDERLCLFVVMSVASTSTQSSDL